MSLYRKIQIIFLLVFIFASAFFLSYFYLQKKDNFSQKEKQYKQFFLLINEYDKKVDKIDIKSLLLNNNIKISIKENKFRLIKNKLEKKSILINSSIEVQRDVLNTNIKVLRIHNTLYLFLKNPKYELLFEDKQVRNFPKQTVVAYAWTLIFLFALYFWIIRSLSPLKELEKKIKKISNGDLSINLKSNKNDEIANIANSFDDALRKIEDLISSRQLFLRSIMHEFKTPIAKGKLLNEFLDDEKQKQSYDNIFNRLTLLIEELSKIEKLLSSSYILKLKKCNVINIVEYALELMFIDEDDLKNKVSIIKKQSNIVNVDFELFTLCIKNLLDNAIEYSPNKKVEIIIYKDKIIISNHGKKFTNSLETYKKPFSYSSNGLGMGLYIVQSIIKTLNLNLSYSHKNEKNTFTISNKY